jgi:hypothetical protein
MYSQQSLLYKPTTTLSKFVEAKIKFQYLMRFHLHLRRFEAF